MNFQNEMKEYFKQQLGVKSGSYADLAASYYKALVKGDIAPQKGPRGPKGADGFPNKEQWNELVARVEALEANKA